MRQLARPCKRDRPLQCRFSFPQRVPLTIEAEQPIIVIWVMVSLPIDCCPLRWSSFEFVQKSLDRLRLDQEVRVWRENSLQIGRPAQEKRQRRRDLLTQYGRHTY